MPSRKRNTKGDRERPVHLRGIRLCVEEAGNGKLSLEKEKIKIARSLRFADSGWFTRMGVSDCNQRSSTPPTRLNLF